MSSTQEVGSIFGEGAGPATAMLRSPTVIIASIGLWGMNVYFFRLFGINYVRVLHLDLVKEKEAMAGTKSSSSQTTKELSDGTEQFVDNGNVPPDSRTGIVMIGSSGKNAEEESTPFTPYSMDHPGAEVTAPKLFFLSFFLLALLHLTPYVWIHWLGGDIITAVFAFYGSVAVGIAVPLPSTQWLRHILMVVLQRAVELVNPRCACNGMPRPIPFIDVFFADGMCSLSKVFFDWGMLSLVATHYPHPVPASTHSIVIPSLVAALPYLIRARQCIIMHTVGRFKNDPKRYQHTLNTIKYLTSIFPLSLSAFQKTLSIEAAEKLEPLLLFLLAVNAFYALTWDIVMDWGMLSDPTAVLAASVVGEMCVPTGVALTNDKTCAHAMLRPRLRFGVLASTGILVADAVLRFSWLLRFYETSLFPSKDVFVLVTQFLEVFRRAIWNLLRVEWEQSKQMKAKRLEQGREKGKVFDAYSDEEDFPLMTNLSLQMSAPIRPSSVIRT